MVEGYGGNVWKYESSGGPNYKCWRKETEALLKPPHLKQVFWRRKIQIRRDLQVFHLFCFSHLLSQPWTYHPKLFPFWNHTPHHLPTPALLWFLSKWNQDSPTRHTQKPFSPIFSHIIKFQGLFILPPNFLQICPFSPSSLPLPYPKPPSFLGRIIITY